MKRVKGLPWGLKRQTVQVLQHEPSMWMTLVGSEALHDDPLNTVRNSPRGPQYRYFLGRRVEEYYTLTELPTKNHQKELPFWCKRFPEHHLGNPFKKKTAS